MEILQKYPTTTFCGPPTAYRMMVKEIPASQYSLLKSTRHFVAAGEPLNKEIIGSWKERTGMYIYDGYGFRPSTALIKELQAFVKNRTAPYKYPCNIEFVDDLPKTISGKIKRKELKMKEFGKI